MNKDIIEEKITNLLRKEKFHLKSHLISCNQNFPWISLSEESNGLSKNFSAYDCLDKEKDADLLNNDKKCRRCSKPVEKIRSCGKANCPYWNPRDLNRPMIKRDLKLDLLNKYFIENLCNNCSDKLEDILNAFYNYWTIGRTPEEFGNKDIEVNAEGGHRGKYFFNTNSKIIKIWEGDNVREFDLKKENLERILNSMNF